MSFLSSLGISTDAAPAAATVATAAPQQGGLLSVLPILVLFVVVFYFMLIRPQSKRAKEQRQLLSALAVGDEVLTTGGIVGRITKLRDHYVAVAIGKEVEMIFQKNAIAAVLPKGTMDSMN